MKKNIRRKIKWRNVIKTIVSIILLFVILRDCYLVIFGSYQWTWFGVFIFMVCVYLFVSIIDDLYEQIKSIPSYKPKHARNTRK